MNEKKKTGIQKSGVRMNNNLLYLSFPQVKRVGNPSEERFPTGRNDGRAFLLDSVFCILAPEFYLDCPEYLF